MADATVARLGAIAERRWGLFTSSQAVAAGITYKQLTRLTANGVVERVIHGVYRVVGAPAVEHELTCAVWLALGGANYRAGEVPPVVAAGTTATTLHGIGDWYQDGFDFIVPARKGTRLPGVRFRIRHLERDEITFVQQLPVLTIERTIADLVEQWQDLSLVAGAVHDARTSGRLLEPDRLAGYLDPLAAARGRSSGAEFLSDLLELAAGTSTPERTISGRRVTSRR